MQQWIKVAALSKAKNNEGGLVVRSAAGLPFLLEEGMEVVFVPPVLRIPRRTYVSEVQRIDDQSAVVFFEGIDSRTYAEQLAGHYCLVRQDDLPEFMPIEGMPDVRSLALFTSDGEKVGVVVDVQDNPAHPIAIVQRAGYEDVQVLVPLVEAWIEKIDPENEELVMSLPAGLLEL